LRSIRREKIETLREKVSRISLRDRLIFCPHLEGFEIRNVLLEAGSNRLIVLDPGAVTTKCALQNIADFLVSIDILYRGTLWFFLGRTPPAAMGAAFLDGYQSRSPLPADWIAFFKIKELVHSWSAACLVLDRRDFPAPVKRLLQAGYIDPFYIRALDRCLEDFERAHAKAVNRVARSA
jgi:hypothetical protein